MTAVPLSAEELAELRLGPAVLSPHVWKSTLADAWPRIDSSLAARDAEIARHSELSERFALEADKAYKEFEDANRRAELAEAKLLIQTAEIARLRVALLSAVHAVHDLTDLKPHRNHRRWQDCPDAVCRAARAALGGNP